MRLKYKHGSEEFINQKFNKLTIISPINREIYKDRTLPFVNVRCDCGEIFKINIQFVFNGHSKSCGCVGVERFRKIGKEKTIGYGLGARNALLNRYKKNARRRSIKWELSDDLFFELCQKNCHFCGCLPHRLVNEKGFNGDFVYNGIDRLNNFDFYNGENCVPCCSDCNYAKKQMTEQEFLNWVERVYNFRIAKKNT